MKNLLKIISLIFVLIVGVTFTSKICLSAQFVVLKIGILKESIAIKDLRDLVDKNEVSPSLEFYLKKANTEPKKLRAILNQEIEVDPVTLAKVLNSPIGEILLDKLSEVIMTPSERASRESLRGALVTSALEDHNITLMEILENYPTSEVHIDGDRLTEVYNRLNGILRLMVGVENQINPRP